MILMRKSSPSLELPILFPAMQHSVQDWEFETVRSDRYCLAMDGVCMWPRGKVLGGSSVLNAMMYVRGNRHDYDRWASEGNPGWNYDEVLPYFKKSEDMRDPVLAQSEFHGTGGGLTVEPFRSASPLADMTLEAGREMGLLNNDNDGNGQTQFGFSKTQGTVREGLRCSTNKAFLRPAARRPNLHVALNAFVERILIDPATRRAFGVQFSRDDESRTVFATKEIISSAGAIQSPQLLMVSGIGPTAELARHGIDVIQDAPGVGENLQDHVAMSGSIYLIENPLSKETLSYIVPKVLNVRNIREFLFNKRGPLYAMPAAEVMAFVNSKYQDPSVDWPDLQVFFAAYSDIADGGLFSTRGSGVTREYYAEVFEPNLYKDAIMIIPLVMRPNSRGKIVLQSANPREYPLIFANYFDDPSDLEILVRFTQSQCDREQNDGNC